MGVFDVQHKKGPFNGGTGRDLIFSHVMYSDTAGRSWRVGAAIPGGNECHSVLARDGSLLMTMRTNTLKRNFAWSTDKGASFSAPTNKPFPYDYAGGQCESTMLALPGPTRPLLLSTPFSQYDKNTSTNPGALVPPRANGTLFISRDNGHNWEFYRSVLSNGLNVGFGYSAMTVIK